MPDTARQLLTLTTQIVAAYLHANTVAIDAVSGPVKDVHRSLSSLKPAPSGEARRASRAIEPQPTGRPAVDIRKTIFASHMICLEDGKRVTMLKRHLRTAHSLTPELYRAKWGLPGNYPMVAPNYAKMRSTMAKASGLGKRG
jgi:predicted transcriptional regulator